MGRKVAHEFISLPRQSGKTTYLIERVQEAQDDGAEMVMVVTSSSREARRWERHLLDWEIDPSRIRVFNANRLETVREFAAADRVFVDNIDLFTNSQIYELYRITDLFGGIDVQTVTG